MDNLKKHLKIRRIIYHNFFLEEKFPIFSQNNLSDSKILDDLFLRLVSTHSDPYKLIKDVEKFSDITCYSFKRIYLLKGEKDILFCCSSISPKKLTEKEFKENSNSENISDFSSCDSSINNKKNPKRINTKSCPMRIKFFYNEFTNLYEITDDSNFNHNHSSIADSFEVNFIFNL